MKISSDLKYRKKENCNNCGLIKLYFSKDVIVTKEAVIKSPVSVMAEIGGYVSGNDSGYKSSGFRNFL